LALRSLVANIYEAEPDEGGFWAEVPELPGCVAQGETLAEVQTNIIDAVGVWLETSIELDTAPNHPSLRATFDVWVDDSKLVPA
jgi:predicted RNase H-like HicB family nuclease